MTLARTVRQAFETANLDPRGISPSALLIVRRMEDPLPRRLLEKGRREASAAWQRAMREKLETLARHAVRPVNGVPGASAEAVLFADMAEMLACLLEDIALGRADSRWWWTSVPARPKGLSPERQIVTLISREMRAIPAAFALLASRGTAADVVRLIPPEIASRLLSEFEGVFEISLANVSMPSDSGDQQTSAAADSLWDRLLPAGTAPPDWLPLDSRMLLGVALALADDRRATLARRFVRELSIRRTGAAHAPQATARDGALDSQTSVDAIRAPEPAHAGLTQTRLGGVFYLINVVRRLGLPASVNADISTWSLVELIARSLIPRTESMDRDPLWRLLAQLDGRPAEAEAGDHCDTPGQLVLPRKLIPPADSIDIRCSGRWTEFLHPMGFPVLNALVPLTPELRSVALELTGGTRLRKALRRYRPRVAGRGCARRLLAFLMPWLRWRLQDIGDFWSAPATVQVTRTHLDVTFPPEAASAAVRMAGLDVNPGWVPAIGRVVTFHFSGSD